MPEHILTIQQRRFRLQMGSIRLQRIIDQEKTARRFAHTLSQPLMVIMTYAQNSLRLLQSGMEPNDTLIQAMAKVVEKSREASQLLNELKHENQSSEKITEQPKDLSELIDQVAAFISRDSGASPMNFAVQGSTDLLLIAGDSSPIQQILLDWLYSIRDLVENHQANHQVAITVHPHPPQQARITVILDGLGSTSPVPANLSDDDLLLPENQTLAKDHGGSWQATPEDGTLTLDLYLPLNLGIRSS